MKQLFFVGIFLLTSICSTQLTAQYDTGAKLKNNPNAQKIRSLINDDSLTPRLEPLKDTTQLLSYTIAPIPKTQFLRGKKEAIRQTYHHWRYGISSGVGLRIAPISSKLSSNLAKRKRNLRFGVFAGFDGNHFFSENVGLGLKYNLFKSANVIEDFSGTLPYFDEEFTGRLTDNVWIHYVGPSFVLRAISHNKKIHTSYDLSVGYTYYHNNNKINDNSYTITGGNVSFTSSVSADFMVSRNMAVGLNFNVIAASLNSVTVNNNEYHLNNEKTENLSRVTLALILRLYR